MRLLVHLHVFYQDQVPFFLERLANISACDWDLVVTYFTLNDDVRDAITSFRLDTRFVEVENCGYDIWPFISVLKSTDISSYDLVLKLHTKGTSEKIQRLNGLRFKGNQWRDSLVNPLIGSSGIFLKNLRRFENDAELGLLCGFEVLRRLSESLPEDRDMLEDECRRLGVSMSGKHFCAGTVFMARMSPYGIFKSQAIDVTLFEGQTHSHSVGSMSHVYERILSLVVSTAGYRIGSVFNWNFRCMKVLLHNVVSPFLKSIFSIDRFGHDRVKCLSILGIRIPLEKPSQKQR